MPKTVTVPKTNIIYVHPRFQGIKCTFIVDNAGFGQCWFWELASMTDSAVLKFRELRLGIFILAFSAATSPVQSRTRARTRFDQSSAAMGKVPVRLKEVAYTLSPYHQQVMAGLWKDIPYKLSKKFHENWVSAFTLVVPIVGTYMYAENFREQEKLHHRY